MLGSDVGMYIVDYCGMMEVFSYLLVLGGAVFFVVVYNLIFFI